MNVQRSWRDREEREKTGITCKNTRESNKKARENKAIDVGSTVISVWTSVDRA